MNHIKIYNQIIDNAKSQNRVKTKENYYESHHIIPDFMFKNRKRTGPKGHLDGDPDDKNNIVLLTAREHFISHVLLARHYDNTHYYYPCASALQFFFTKVIDDHPRAKSWSASGSKKYEKYRIEGIEAISKSRKGKMPAVDAITREKKGSVDINHPKVLSGEWVHHSKGITYSEESKKKRSEISKGSMNSNYKGWTQNYENISLSIMDEIVDNNNIISKSKFLETIKERYTERKDRFSETLIGNNFGPFREFLIYINQKYDRNFQQRVVNHKRNIK